MTSDATESTILSQDINKNKLAFTRTGRMYKYGMTLFVECNQHFY